MVHHTGFFLSFKNPKGNPGWGKTSDWDYQTVETNKTFGMDFFSIASPLKMEVLAHWPIFYELENNSWRLLVSTVAPNSAQIPSQFRPWRPNSETRMGRFINAVVKKV